MKRTKLARLAVTFLLGITLFGRESIAEDLNCLSESERVAAGLYAHLQQEAYAALDRRMAAYEQLKTPEQIRAYQRKLREFFVKQLGGFPDRTPLNSRTVRTIPRDGYRIENVIFESRPQHHVTANLYLPDSKSPVPGIVVSSGHSRTGKTADYNQRFGIMMAQHGMAALCFDPIGQGERSQILNADGQPEFKGTTTEHFLIGVGSILVGRNTAGYRVWDAMRSIDYLAGRPEVDAQRIGFTGCSGGGTLTSYVMALDDRVTCAAPACYLTTFRRLIETIGPQDAEQNIYGQIAFGLDHPDYVVLRAPRPTLISSTSNDFFNIHGSWDNYRQAKRIYARLGFPERVDLVEVEGKHGVQPQNLATIAHWMKRWLLDSDKPVAIAKLDTLPSADLLCTTSGQVLGLPGERSVFDLNVEHEAKLAKQRKVLWDKTPPNELVAKIRTLIGVRPNSELKPPKWKDLGRIRRANYHIDKLMLSTDSGVPLPALTFHPPTPMDDAYLYLHDEGKLGDAAANGPIESLIDDGYAVVTVDLRGQGETSVSKRDALLSDWKTYYLAYLLGKPLVGLRVEDALAAGDFVAYYQKKRTAPRKVHLVGVGQAGIVALHAAALNPELFASVTLRKTPRAWAAVLKQQAAAGQLDSTVHGALEVYDLPDLVRLAGKDKVRFED
ncbi:MAG: acetylxylan esterase [Planctomycetota bacterium]|nr:acetylxylan esterase [Planctomycetota bacterium]